MYRYPDLPRYGSTPTYAASSASPWPWVCLDDPLRAAGVLAGGLPVMVLRWLGGLSDREAVDRYAFEVRWRYAAGVGGCGGGGWAGFAQMVLVDMRARLRRSARPDRIFEVGLQAAHAAGLVGRRRVLDSTPLYDAVASRGAGRRSDRRDETRQWRRRRRCSPRCWAHHHDHARRRERERCRSRAQADFWIPEWYLGLFRCSARTAGFRVTTGSSCGYRVGSVLRPAGQPGPPAGGWLPTRLPTRAFDRSTMIAETPTAPEPGGHS
jgi:hypothetical protein